MYFFFQAEDGIRDWSVTGVQTCALPISFLRAAAYVWAAQVAAARKNGVREEAIDLLRAKGDAVKLPADERDRSEERRVGKECGARGGLNRVKQDMGR